MLKAREILRLKHQLGLSLREIGKSCNCGKTTVSEVLERAKAAGITWPIGLSDKQLMSLLYPLVEQQKNPVPEPNMEYIFLEMKKKHVTLMMLWEEYKNEHHDGIMYTQFCERYRKFKKVNQLEMHIEHKAGEEMQVDWAGTTLSYVDRGTGESHPAYIFVSVLPASNYPFAYAYGDTKLPNWIDAHVKAFEYFGGVPKVTIPDNTKTAVITPDLVDPLLNKTYHEMAQFYRTTLVPARSLKPKDKASDENMVGNISRRVIAALRNRRFFSLYEINQAIKQELNKFIHRSFQKIPGNRQIAFERIDKPALQSLPAKRYEFAEWKESKVAFNYHVEFEGFFYSVSFTYVGQPCSIRATIKTIEVFIAGERVAAHPRNFNPYKRYTTLPEHMPESHKAIAGWNTDRFLSWAEKIGPHTRQLIQHVLESREYPVQTYRACMGIMRLSKSYPSEMMEKASQKALNQKTYSYKYISIILKQVTTDAGKPKAEKIIEHANIRGSQAYTGGGIHA